MFDAQGKTQMVPDPGRARTRHEFARELTLLRELAGLTVRQVAARVGVRGAHSTIGDWFAGRGLPSTSSASLLVGVLKACGVTEPEPMALWLEAWRRVRRAPGPRPAGPEPYRGLAPFQPEDAEWYFGRAKLTAQLVKQLRAGPQIVVGASGSGKSSLLRAGLVPSLGTVALLTPGSHPPRRLSGLDGTVIVVDQFEEVFTACRDEEARSAFVEAICAERRPVVLGLRADFYPRVLRYPGLVASVRSGQFVVGPMTEDELREAIVRPAQKARIDIEEGLVELLLRDMTPHEAGALPLLSHALFTMWYRGSGRRLTISDYRQAGGIAGAVAASATRVYDGLPPERRDLARRLFLSLVHIAPDTADTRRRADRAEWQAGHDLATVEELEDVLESFVAQRLITAGATTVEISHEALLTAWPQLRSWLDTDRAGLVIGRRLHEAAATWRREERDPAALYRGTRLAAAREWAESRGPRGEPSPPVREFLAASRERELAEQAAERRHTLRLRRLVAGLSVLAVLTTAAAVIAVNSRQELTRQRNIAVSRRVAGEVAQLRVANPALAAQLSLAAYRLAPTAEALSALLSTFGRPYMTRLSGHTGYIGVVRYSPDGRTLASGSSDRLWDVSEPHRPSELAAIDLRGDEGVGAIDFGAGGRVLAVSDGKLRLWDLTDRRHPKPYPAEVPDVAELAFRPDGRLLATTDPQGTAKLWDVSDPRRLTEVGKLSGQTTGVALKFAPDGRTLATAGLDGTLKLWDVTDSGHPAELAQLSGLAGLSMAFGPDGRLFLIQPAENTLALWDASDRRHPVKLAELSGHTGLIYAAEFSPDGRSIATASADNTIKHWDITDPARPQELTTLISHTGGVIDTNAMTSVAFSPDGRTLATASLDQFLRLWDLGGPIITGRSRIVRPAGFAGSRGTLALEENNAISLWDISDPHSPAVLSQLTGEGAVVCDEASEVICAAVGPDGRTIATGGVNGTIRLWGEAAHNSASVTGIGEPIDGLRNGPGGLLVSVSSRSGTVRLWDTSDPGQLVETARFSAHAQPVNLFAISQDGRLLATTSYDRTARLWDISDRRAPALLSVIAGHAGAVYSAAFHPGGRLLATAGHDTTVRLWDITDPRHPTQVTVLTGHTNFVNDVVFGEAGRVLASVAGDGAVRLWDVSDPGRVAEVATLSGHTASVNHVLFSPDGTLLITGGYDHSVRLWVLDPDKVAKRVCELAFPPITRAEWDRWFPGLKFQAPCRNV